MLKVECYTSSKSNERPVAFSLSNSRYKVEEIIDRWYGEGSRYFKIKADDDNIYLLKYDERKDRWEWVFYQNNFLKRVFKYCGIRCYEPIEP